ncbi:MAG TPA: EAL domain-containing protein [Solirubrobacteraceae bacterium]|nr:EAL domain-containing protein [Solirubrobacteraceae bacterium]
MLSDPSLVRPAFQPIFDLARGRVCGYEALARFEVGPPRSPEDWLRAAADRDLENALEAALIEAGLRARSALPENCFLSVNVSPGTLLSEEVQRAIAAAGRLDAVVIELTEREPISDYDTVRDALDAIRELGGMVAVDDAGAGYASLQHIMGLRPEFIKLDRALVAGLDVDAAKLALVEAVGSFAARIDAWLVAEGIERRAELDAVRAISVPLGQGFGLGRPARSMEAAPATIAHDLSTAPVADGDLGTVSVLAYPRPLPEAQIADAAERFALEPDAELLVLVDDLERPAGLLRRSPEPHIVRSPMCVLTSEAPEELARRAMTRPLHERFDPLIACDERGRYVGLLEADRLVHLLSKIVNQERKPS